MAAGKWTAGQRTLGYGLVEEEGPGLRVGVGELEVGDNLPEALLDGGGGVGGFARVRQPCGGDRREGRGQRGSRSRAACAAECEPSGEGEGEGARRTRWAWVPGAHA